LSLFVIIPRFPSVAILPALNILIPTLTKGAALIIQLLLIEENAVTASATLRDILASGGPVVVR
tara:strand:+ start:733 stop:924 length:192 start_codon:yes stop_codon:yes gene_type:complete